MCSFQGRGPQCPSASSMGRVSKVWTLKERRAVWGELVSSGWCPTRLEPGEIAAVVLRTSRGVEEVLASHPEGRVATAPPGVTPLPVPRSFHPEDWLPRLHTMSWGQPSCEVGCTLPSPGMFLKTKQSNLLP